MPVIFSRLSPLCKLLYREKQAGYHPSGGFIDRTAWMPSRLPKDNRYRVLGHQGCLWFYQKVSTWTRILKKGFPNNMLLFWSYPTAGNWSANFPRPLLFQATFGKGALSPFLFILIRDHRHWAFDDFANGWLCNYYWIPNLLEQIMLKTSRCWHTSVVS